MNNLATITQTRSGNTIMRKLFSYRETTVLLVIIVLSVVLSIVSPYFLTSSNLSTTGLGLASDGIMAVGMCLVLLTAGIDLSVGSVMAASMVIAGILYINFGVNIWITSLIALAYSAFCGYINGLFIGKIGVNALITTLAMMNMSRGVAYVLSQGSPVSLPNPGPSFTFIGAGDVFGIPMFVIILVVVAVLVSYMLTHLGFMRKIFYTGSNEKAAKLSGINIAKIKIGVYMASGFLAGLAGILSLSRFTVATPNAGLSSELRVISACIIGGTSLIGGEGSILGAVLGIIMLNIINNGLVLLNVSVYWQDLISGLILLIAVTIDFLSQERKKKARLQNK